MEKSFGKVVGEKIEKNPQVAENIAWESNIVSRTSEGKWSVLLKWQCAFIQNGNVFYLESQLKSVGSD